MSAFICNVGGQNNIMYELNTLRQANRGTPFFLSSKGESMRGSTPMTRNRSQVCQARKTFEDRLRQGREAVAT